MRPGISRGVSGGIIGFIAGFLIVAALRLAFNFTPLIQPGLSLVLATFLSAYGFVWGMGGFSNVMNQHPDDSAPIPTMEEEEQRVGPGGIVMNTTWKAAGWTVGILSALWLFMTIPGSDLTVTRNAGASVSRFGNVMFELFGQEVVINQIFFLGAFMLFTLLSLAAAGGAFGFLFYALNRNVKEVASQSRAVTPDNRLTRGAGNTARRIAGVIAPKAQGSTEIVRFDPMQAEHKD